MLEQLEEIRGACCAFHSEARCSHLEGINVNLANDSRESTWNLDSPTCGGVYLQLRGYLGWRNTCSVTQRDDCCAKLSVQFGTFCHLKGQYPYML